MLSQTYKHVLYDLRFGGSRSSQNPAASKDCDGTAASATEDSDRAADSDSEEGENPKDDLDPFSSQGPTDGTKSETCCIL